MKKIICFVLISFFGVMFSLGEMLVNSDGYSIPSANNERGKIVYIAKYYLYEDNSGSSRAIKEALPGVVDYLADSFESIGYVVLYNSSTWEYSKPYDSFEIYFMHSDPEYAELTIHGCVRDFGRHLINLASVRNVGMFAVLEDGIKIQI